MARSPSPAATIVLIPSFEPTERLAEVVRGVRALPAGLPVLVVDDGSGPEFAPAFDAARAAGAEVIGYPRNRGKGFALRTGIRHVLASSPGSAIVSADGDGQHRASDILRVADRLSRDPDALVLGGRRFQGTVPLRSRLGNAVARRGFGAVTGLRIGDTQTGLRGFPVDRLDWLLTVPGDRFEYELTVLLRASAAGLRVEEIGIDTIYLDQNASSHFRPMADSLRVMRPLITFAAVSLASFLLDVLVLQVLYTATGSLLVAVVGARVLSGSANFTLNRLLVFTPTGTTARRDAVRYTALAAALLVVNYGWLASLTALGVALLPAKLVTEASVWLIGFVAQRRYVFRPVDRPMEADASRVVLTAR